MLGAHQNIEQNISMTPSVDLDKAIKNSGQLAGSMLNSRLVIWSDGERTHKLSYEVISEFAVAQRGAELQKVYIDAQTGEVLRRISLMHSALNRQVNDFSAACRNMNVRIPLIPPLTDSVEKLAQGKFFRKEGQGPLNSDSVDRGYELLGEGYEFIQNIIGMDSLDDDGLLLNMFVNVRFQSRIPGLQCVGDTFNAAWVSHKQSLYIPQQGLEYVEVTLHELGHGIVSNGSNLEYLFQPGALNESIADAIGVSFRAWRDLGRKSSNEPNLTDDIWQIRFPDRIVRDMSNPRAVIHQAAQYPDHMEQYLNWPESKDYGGVHFNSSIMNLGFYLLANGGPHPTRPGGQEVKGIGILKAVKIYAQAGAKLLVSRSSFEDARFAFAQVAESFYGVDSQEWISVHQAMDVIGISGSWVLPESESELEPIPETKDTQTLPMPEKSEAPVPESTEQENGTDKKLIIVLVLGGLGFIIAVLALTKMKPKYGETEPLQSYKADSRVTTKEVASGAILVSASVQSNLASKNTSNKVFVSLQSLDGQQLLPLREDLLTAQEGLIIGRALELVHIQMDDRKVSRRHLRLRLVRDKVAIEDLNSTFGTCLDGKKLLAFRPEYISVGQLVRIAEFSYVLK